MFKKNKNKPWWKKLKGKKVVFYPVHDLPGVNKADVIPGFPEYWKENSSKPTEVLFLLLPTGKEHLYFDFIHKIPYSEGFMWKNLRSARLSH